MSEDQPVPADAGATTAQDDTETDAFLDDDLLAKQMDDFIESQSNPALASTSALEVGFSNPSQTLASYTGHMVDPSLVL